MFLRLCVRWVFRYIETMLSAQLKHTHTQCYVLRTAIFCCIGAIFLALAQYHAAIILSHVTEWRANTRSRIVGIFSTCRLGQVQLSENLPFFGMLFVNAFMDDEWTHCTAWRSRYYKLYTRMYLPSYFFILFAHAGTIKLYCKGADNVIFARLTEHSRDTHWGNSEKHLAVRPRDVTVSLCENCMT